MKFVLGTSWDIKFVILVEDSDTSGLNLITVKLKYLLCNSDVVKLVRESNKGEAGSIIVNFCYLGVLNFCYLGAESLSESVEDSLV